MGLGGVPKEQLNLVSRDPQVFSDRLVEVLRHRMWVKNNYFYYGYLVGQFAPDCCPRYLEKESFPILQKNVDRITVYHGTLADAAENVKHDGITLVSILDAMDWMPDALVADTISRVMGKMHPTKGRFYWRSLAPFVHSPVLAQLKPTLVPQYDRVGWYLSQWKASMPQKVTPTLMDPPCTPIPIRVNTFLEDAKILAVMGLSAFAKEKDVQAFYKRQADVYD